MVLPPNTAKRADREPSVSRLIIGPSSHLTCLSVSTPTYKGNHVTDTLYGSPSESQRLYGLTQYFTYEETEAQRN